MTKMPDIALDTPRARSFLLNRKEGKLVSKKIFFPKTNCQGE